ncbi:hypothetical protein FLJC2902T_04730 [Flavobacterium limnosediminis JC2902]|uniref:Outer membrane protein beta-barrel domain-containing protein n=1 Tax=Flavobacterium limnosediminis JC2902 TaxID=1341181 RepID=V6STE9_9FLAO|nr:hypothetical protein [Flavobacterium limnosediminis]ESU29988.1 hypothetical protein FLJC2902T_04730 [Flavobacterium limnosediminis JC2902]
MRKFIPKVSVPLMLLLGSVLHAQTEEITKTTEVIPVAKDTVGDSNLRDVPWYVERYRISAGFYEMINKTNVTIQGSSNQGTDLDFERDLGIDKTNETFYADFEWRSSSRSRFNLNYFNSRRKNSRTLDRDITIGDETYAINTNLNTTIETDFFRFSYGYAILSKPKYEVGLLVGTHTITTKIGIKVEGENADFEKNKTYDAVAPLVDFGVWGGYAFTDRFALRGEINYFQLKVDIFDGRTFGYNVSAVYRVWKKLDLSLGYSGLDLNVNFDTDNVSYDVDWGHSGVMLYASYSLGNKKWR